MSPLEVDAVLDVTLGVVLAPTCDCYGCWFRGQGTCGCLECSECGCSDAGDRECCHPDAYGCANELGQCEECWDGVE